MTSKELQLQQLNMELSKKERELEEIQKEVSLLKAKIEETQNIPDSYFDQTLESCEDFPLHRAWAYKIGDIIGTVRYNNVQRATVNDLIHSSPEKILKVDGIGKAKLKLIMDWMETHDLHFLS